MEKRKRTESDMVMGYSLQKLNFLARDLVLSDFSFHRDVQKTKQNF